MENKVIGNFIRWFGVEDLVQTLSIIGGLNIGMIFGEIGLFIGYGASNATSINIIIMQWVTAMIFIVMAILIDEN